MKTFIVLALCLGVALCSEWEAYKREHGKVYKNPTENKFRQLIYKDRVAKINAHNALFEKGEVTYKQGINRFTDMTGLEVKEMMNGLDMSLKNKPVKIPKRPYKSSGVAAPASMDWRTYNYVTGVKDQGQCGSCWSFSTTGAVEGQWAKTKGQLISLSEQQLVDCSTANYGCNGGWPSVAYEYLWGPTGSEHEENYPYEAIDDVCRYNSAYVAATISAYVEIPQYNENSLLDAAGSAGPISVCIDASHDSFQAYSSGVYYEPNCDQNNLDHAVLVAGYGNENGQDYWLVKNSWGTGWGEQGYIKMSRGRGNNCGIASAATYPLV